LRSHRNRLTRGAIAAAFILCTGTAFADILVVRSTGASAKQYPPGKRIAEGARIVLPANASLDVLDGRGTRTLRGPGSFVAGAVAPRSAAPAPVARRARIGAVRSAGISDLRPPSIWHVDIARSSSVCVAEPANVILWRADPVRAVNLTVSSAAAGPSKRIAWQPGASTLAWPADLAVANGAEYRLSWPGAAAPTIIRFRTLPTKPVGLEDLASFLVSNQCEAQLDMFIETVRLPDEGPPGG